MEDPEIKAGKSPLQNLIKLVESLRGPDGCPWDQKQTPQSMMVYLIEEIYELADAIESDNPDEVREELGDVLFHIFFLARMFQEIGAFSIDDVALNITQKMRRRHPHVFGTDIVNSTDDIVQNWTKIKLSERNKPNEGSLIDTVPDKLPALMRAYLISDRISKAGFESASLCGNLKEVEKNLAELMAGLPDTDKKWSDRQIGDMLFKLVNVARCIDIHPESALSGSLKRFEDRFKRLEGRIRESGKKFQDLSEHEKDQLWAELED